MTDSERQQKAFAWLARRRCRNAAIFSLALAVTCLVPRFFGFVLPLLELASLSAFYLALRLAVGAIRPGSFLDRIRPRGVGRVVRREG